ncbi:hypothetical protein Tco_0416414 [Tanacetum coccineum]
MAPKRRTTRSTPITTTPPPVADTHTTTSVTSAQLQAMIDEGVTAVLAARATTRNGDDSHTSGTGGHRRSGRLVLYRILSGYQSAIILGSFIMRPLRMAY